MKDPLECTEADRIPSGVTTVPGPFWSPQPLWVGRGFFIHVKSVCDLYTLELSQWQQPYKALRVF